MPIPYYIPENTLSDAGPRLQLIVPPSAKAVPKTSLFLSARLAAHFLDVSLVGGLSAYTSKLLTLAILSFYGAEFESFGSSASDVFADAFDYANGQLFGACGAFFGILYFVALPTWSGRTLGQGLLGLKVVDANGASPSVLALARRLLSCVLIYVSGGSLLLSSLRVRQSRLPQDSFSETFVTKV
ncbi:MAG: RDD family protein [Bdellovibrionota bacterium]